MITVNARCLKILSLTLIFALPGLFLLSQPRFGQTSPVYSPQDPLGWAVSGGLAKAESGSTSEVVKTDAPVQGEAQKDALEKATMVMLVR